MLSLFPKHLTIIWPMPDNMELCFQGPGGRGVRLINLFALWHLFFPSTVAYDSSVKWSSVFETPLYDDLPTCAKPCMANVCDSSKCWSWGCVCSENTPGANFINGTKHIKKCVQDDCPEPGEGTIDSALNAFKSACGMSGITINATTPDEVSRPSLAPGRHFFLPLLRIIIDPNNITEQEQNPSSSTTP